MSPDDANLSLTHDSLSPADDPTSRANIVGIYDQGTTQRSLNLSATGLVPWRPASNSIFQPPAPGITFGGGLDGWPAETIHTPFGLTPITPAS